MICLPHLLIADYSQPITFFVVCLQSKLALSVGFLYIVIPWLFVYSGWVALEKEKNRYGRPKKVLFIFIF